MFIRAKQPTKTIHVRQELSQITNANLNISFIKLRNKTTFRNLKEPKIGLVWVFKFKKQQVFTTQFYSPGGTVCY